MTDAKMENTIAGAIQGKLAEWDHYPFPLLSERAEMSHAVVEGLRDAGYEIVRGEVEEARGELTDGDFNGGGPLLFLDYGGTASMNRRTVYHHATPWERVDERVAADG